MKIPSNVQQDSHEISQGAWQPFKSVKLMLQQFSPSAGRPHDDLDKYMDILLKVFKMFTKVYVVEKLVLLTIGGFDYK